MLRVVNTKGIILAYIKPDIALEFISSYNLNDLFHERVRVI